MKRYFLFVLLVLSSPVLAVDLTESQKLDDLNQAVSMIKSGYGPLNYKKEHYGIDVVALQAKYSDLVKQTKSNAEFYYLMNQFIAEFHDSHFKASVPTDYVAELGFVTDLVDNKVVIESVDRNVLTKEVFPFERGDELVSIDGVSAEELLKKFGSYRGMGNALSEKRVGALLLTFRTGSSSPVPTGKVNVEFRPRLQNWLTKTVELEWKVSGTPLDEALEAASGDAKAAPVNTRQSRLNLSLVPLWKDYLQSRYAEKGFRCSGKTRIAIPLNATKIIETPFVAYYHPHPTNPAKTIGYLRLPDYVPADDVPNGGEEQFEIRFRQYERAVAILEEKTDGLIIDQDHNCGGSVSYLERLLGLFMTTPYDPMQFETRASKPDYLSIKSELPSIPQNTLEYDQVLAVLGIIKTSWTNGDFLTPKVSFTVPGKVAPNGIHYTKPIIVTIDEMSGSGGDAFPSLLQGYGRAKLLGTRTMGAGGHVEEQAPLFNSGLNIRMTKSLFYRPDGVAVENNGAEPDFPYTVTVDDYVNGFSGYQKFYLDKILSLIP